MSRILRISGIGLLVLLITAPVTFFVFALGVVVHEMIIRPVAVLTAAVIASVVASWAADGLIRDGRRALVNQVALWNLTWALIPAVLILSTLGTGPPAVWIALTVVYTTTVGVVLALRHRTDDPAEARRGVATTVWLVGTAAAVGLVIFIASLFGLTGP